MHEVQKMVDEFQEKFRLTRPRYFTPYDAKNRELRIELIREEAEEFTEAAREEDPVAMIDALCDLLYVTYGAAVALGIDLEPFMAEVHHSNMAKLGPDGQPIYREDGKLLKPAGWTPPDLKRVFAEEVTGTLHPGCNYMATHFCTKCNWVRNRLTACTCTPIHSMDPDIGVARVSYTLTPACAIHGEK